MSVPDAPRRLRVDVRTEHTHTHVHTRARTRTPGGSLVCALRTVGLFVLSRGPCAEEPLMWRSWDAALRGSDAARAHTREVPAVPPHAKIAQRGRIKRREVRERREIKLQRRREDDRRGKRCLISNTVSVLPEWIEAVDLRCLSAR